jgi:hypothetical protein
MFHDRAHRVGSTDILVLAWICAALIDTWEIVGASSVGSTSSRAHLTIADLSITAIVVLAAQRLASTAIAAFVVEASSVVGANWSAEVIEASWAITAVAIFSARKSWWSGAANLSGWTWNHSSRARATRSLVGDCAHRVRSARIFLARIFAFVVEASFAAAAVFVVVAAEDALVVQANVSEEAVIVDAAGEHAVLADALLVESAFLVSAACWQAHWVRAGFTRDAVSVGRAGNGNANAFNIRVPGESSWAW